jgi:hypothetical protein
MAHNNPTLRSKLEHKKPNKHNHRMVNVPHVNDHHAKNKRHSQTLATTQLKPNSSNTNIHGATPNISELPIRRAHLADTATSSLHGHFLSIHNHRSAQKPQASNRK